MAARKPPSSPSRTRFGLTDTDFLKTARARFKFADTADTEQRMRERDDLAFYAGDQWPADIRLARQGQQSINGMPAVPSRPTLVINNVREPVRQVANEAYSSDLGVEITPAEDFGDLGITPDTTEIKLREGLVRKIQRESQARDARMWAFDRAVKVGRGYYQVLTRYLPGKTYDQELYVHRIYNQAAVLLDPSHEEPDGSDAKWGFVCVDMLWDDYITQFPSTADGKENKLISDMSASDWETLGNEYPKWFRNAEDSGSGQKSSDKDAPRAVRVVDYWYTESESRDLCALSDGSVMWKDDIKEIPESKGPRGKKIPARLALPKGIEIVDTRTVTQQTIRWCKIDGAQVLEDYDWAGPDMPIIKVMGEELQPYDGERRAEGMVRPARDSQMGLNYMISKQVEMVGLTPLTPLIGDPDAVEGFPEWDLLNTRVVPMARYRSYDDQGRPLKEPHRPNADPNLLPISQSIALFSAQIEKTTAVPAARLGDIDPVTRSGKALDRLTANSQKSTSNFMQNLLRSVRYEGQIENNLLYPIYGTRPGRLVRIMVGDGKSQTVLVHDAPQQAAVDPQMQALMQRAQSVAKLTQDAAFNVNITVTRDFDTRKMEESTQIGEMISQNPQLIAWFGDLFFANLDGPGHEQMAERAKVMLAPPIQQMLQAQANGQAPASPHEMQLMAENQKLHGALQQAALEKQGKVIEGQIKLQQTNMQEQHEDVRAAADRETKIAVAELGAKVDRLALFLEERARLGANIHDAAQGQADRTHEAVQADAQRQQDAQQADAERQMAARTQAMDASREDTQQFAQAQQPQNGNGA